MENKKQLPPEEALEPTYLELMAYFGMTRHSGGWKATTEIIELCQIEKGVRVLDVGCGTGKTSCYLAERHGCSVVGVDLSARMVAWSGETAKREGIADKVEFRVADAQDLPFEDGLFDVVINESVLAFVPDQQKALREYLRVMKPGGYIGLNESTWLKMPLPTELTYYFDSTFLGARLETADGWRELLIGSGLKDVVVRTYRLTAQSERMDRIKWFGFSGLVRNVYRMLSFSLSSPANRKTMKKLIKMSLGAPESFYEYYGYGIYVGRLSPERGDG